MRCLLQIILFSFFLSLGPHQVMAKTKLSSQRQRYLTAMKSALAEYHQKHWQKTLPHLKKALKALKGRPIYEKGAAYIYTGLTLFHLNQKGLAWKALEKALYAGVNAFPSKESSEARAFFDKVRQRVIRRGGPFEIKSAPKSAVASSSHGKIYPITWGLVALSAAGVVAGILFMMNSSAISSEVDRWLDDTALQEPTRQKDYLAISKPISEASNSSSLLGITSFSIAGASALGAAAVYFLIENKSSSRAKVAKITPSLPSQSRRAWAKSFQF